jgi:uncharacterized coiled-coil protein SlyX
MVVDAVRRERFAAYAKIGRAVRRKLFRLWQPQTHFAHGLIDRFSHSRSMLLATRARQLRYACASLHRSRTVMNEESIERLELKLAFVERANQELSDVVYRQQQELDALRLQMQQLIAQFDVLREEPTKYSAEQERPPHY